MFRWIESVPGASWATGDGRYHLLATDKGYLATWYKDGDGGIVGRYATLDEAKQECEGHAKVGPNFCVMCQTNNCICPQ